VRYGIGKSSLYEHRNKAKFGNKSRDEIKELVLENRIKTKLNNKDGYVHVNLKNADSSRDYFFADLLQRGWSMDKLFHYILKVHYSIASNRPYIKEYDELKSVVAGRVKL
jgi:hypothetical protein